MSVPHPYLDDTETGEQMLTRLGYRWERKPGAGEYATRQLVRASDGHVMALARTMSEVNHWAAKGCPDLAGATHSIPYEELMATDG